MEVGDLGAEPLAGDLEREERPRRILEEGVDLGEPGEPVVGLARPAVERRPRLGLVEDESDVGGGKPLDPEQMAVRERGGGRTLKGGCSPAWTGLKPKRTGKSRRPVGRCHEPYVPDVWRRLRTVHQEAHGQAVIERAARFGSTDGSRCRRLQREMLEFVATRLERTAKRSGAITSGIRRRPDHPQKSGRRRHAWSTAKVGADRAAGSAFPHSAPRFRPRGRGRDGAEVTLGRWRAVSSLQGQSRTCPEHLRASWADSADAGRGSSDRPLTR